MKNNEIFEKAKTWPKELYFQDENIYSVTIRWNRIFNINDPLCGLGGWTGLVISHDNEDYLISLQNPYDGTSSSLVVLKHNDFIMGDYSKKYFEWFRGLNVHCQLEGGGCAWYNSEMKEPECPT